MTAEGIRGAVARLVEREGGRFARFCVVGAAGFLTDAAILALLTHGLGFGPFESRAASFAVAVTVTWLLNRYWAFRAGPASFWRGLLAYLGVQGMGLGCNLLVYGLWVLLLPRPLGDPLVALVVASGSALFVNYVGLRTLVFRLAAR